MCPYQWSLLSFRMRFRSSIPSSASSSVDLMLAVSYSLTLQICLIIALSFRCRRWRLGFVNGFTGMEHCAPHTRAAHTATCLERKVAGRENWYQLLELLPDGFHMCCGRKLTTTSCWEHVSQVAKRSYHPACQTRLEFPSVVCCLRGMQFSGSVYICNLGPLSSAWAHCISYAPNAYSLCRRCCCCPLQCDKQCMGTT